MRERRKRVRIAGKDWLAVKILSTPDLAGRGSRTVFCQTRDMSAVGVQVLADEAIPVDAQVQINLGTTNPVASYLHVGTVRWAQRTEDGQRYCMGVEFTGTAQPVLEAWQRYVTGRAPPSAPPL
jgi:c-di-GMP-binding flagellar brake protein YcgR